MKDVKIQIPNNCDIQTINIAEDAKYAIIIFKELKPQLPKSWEEFCEMFPIQPKEYFIDEMSIVKNALSCAFHEERETFDDRNLLPDRATAEAVLALCQLIQLRNCYNGDWVPDWNNESDKFMIGFYNSDILTWVTQYTASFLYFKTKELRDEFLRCFRDLIEKLKPLYGIKEGGGE